MHSKGDGLPSRISLKFRISDIFILPSKVQVRAMPLLGSMLFWVGWLIEWKFISIKSDESSVPSIIFIVYF
jgi:hypothetical protein